MQSNTSYNVLELLNAKNGDDVSQHHPLYDKHLKQVKLVNDVYEGADSCRDYIFQFPQEIQETYRTRQERATLRNFVHRAVSAFAGMIFRKELQVIGYGARTTRSFETVDTINNIQHFAKEITIAATRDGKAYILIDSPSKEAVEAAGPDDYLAPYMLQIGREQVINWRKDRFGHYEMAIIEEIVAEPHGMFGTRYVRQYRHYDKSGLITIYRNNKESPNQTIANKSGYFIYGEPIQSDYIGVPLIEIDISDVPLLYDAAQMNIKHFNRQSHKDRYLTMAALPIPIIWGADMDDDGKPNIAKPALVIGVDEAFVFTGTKQECDFEWRELSGDSIDLLEKDLDSITEDITTGILRAAETANAVQKTATEVQLLQAEASNRVSSIAEAVETGMGKALEILSFFNNEKVPHDAMFKLSSDFNAALYGSDGVRVVFESYLSGMLSMETFLNTMSEMELINIDSAEAELERIKADNFKPEPPIEPKENAGVTEDPLKGTDNRTRKLMRPEAQPPKVKVE